MGLTLHFVNADAVDIHLTDSVNYAVTRQNILGRAMEPYDIISREIPFEPGAEFDFSRAETRIMVVPLMVLGSNQGEVIDNLEALADAFNPDLGVGQLKLTRGGTTRVINCLYDGGLNNVALGTVTAEGKIRFRADDPFWYADATVNDTFISGTPATFFPFFPLSVSNATVFSDEVLYNNGKVPVFPSWTISGPGDDPILKNITTGKTLALSGVTLGVGVDYHKHQGGHRGKPRRGKFFLFSCDSDDQFLETCAG